MTRAWHILRLAAALLAACALAPPAFADKKSNSIRFASQEVVGNVDPYFNVSNIGMTLADNIWDTLIFRDPQTGTYKGDLATEWRWVNDKTIELDLRQGVTFHNGAEFDADDVVYTLNFISKPESKVFSTISRWIDHADKIGKYKVRIATKQPFPAAIAYLASPKFVIHPHEYYAKVGPKGMNAHPIGTGPFRVVEHALGKSIRLERNPDYFKGSPKALSKIDKVDIRFVPDAQTQVAEIVAGGLDLIWRVNPDQAEQLRDTPALRIESVESINYAILRMNTLPQTPVPQLRDIRVRQAIMHAIDRESIARFLTGKDSRVLHTECHPTDFGCSDIGVPHYAYDPDKARRLLAEAGYPNGFDLDLYAWRDRNQTEAIIGYLAAVGIKARLRFMQATVITSARRAGKVALMDTSWSTGTLYDASNSVSTFHEFSPDDINRDREVRDLLVRADSAPDPAVRKEAYAKALKLIAERAYVLPLYSLPAYFVAAKGLSFRPGPANVLRFWEMSWK